jgi:hypothetical protein
VYKDANAMKKSPSAEINSRSASQQIRRFYGTHGSQNCTQQTDTGSYPEPEGTWHQNLRETFNPK